MFLGTLIVRWKNIFDTSWDETFDVETIFIAMKVAKKSVLQSKASSIYCQDSYKSLSMAYIKASIFITNAIIPFHLSQRNRKDSLNQTNLRNIHDITNDY